jgi:hypothetical protein
MIVGCYTLDLYCDAKNDSHGYKEFPHVYTNHTEGRCKRDARRDGWRFRKRADGTWAAYCPKCSKRKK